MTAKDADDAQDGSNARLTYDIEKNAVVEASGAALFSMEPQTGLIRTARCCLDRETTPEYRLQVIAADGGGLKGECVRVRDLCVVVECERGCDVGNETSVCRGRIAWGGRNYIRVISKSEAGLQVFSVG